jgi:hypothetical protein
MKTHSVLKRFIICTVIIIGTAAAIYFYKEYHRRPADMALVKADKKIDAAKLVTAFTENETVANKLYLGKTLEVTGTVTETEQPNDSLINIFLGGGVAFNQVSCLFDTRLNKFKDPQAGSILTIRGVCTGFLSDVELNRCVMVK